MGYRLLPVSDLPTIDYPTIQVNGQPARAPAPTPWPSSVATPLEKQFSTIAGVTSISSTQQPGQHQHHPAVRLEPRHRLRGAGRPVDDRAVGALAAAGHAVAAVVPEGQPGRSADPLPDPQLEDDAAVEASTSTPNGARAAALDGQRRRRRQRLRRAEIRGSDRRGSRRSSPPGRSASTRSRRRLPARTSTARRARSTGRSATSSSRPAAS